MRRPRADREEKRVTQGNETTKKGTITTGRLDASDPNQRGRSRCSDAPKAEFDRLDVNRSGNLPLENYHVAFDESVPLTLIRTSKRRVFLTK